MTKKISDNGLFSDLEALRIAINMEEQGRAFYQKAHDQSEKENHKSLFKMLADEEDMHFKKFTDMYNELKQEKTAGSDEYLFDAETSKYLFSLTDPKIFTDDKIAKTDLHDLGLNGILRCAIQDEKDAILFYDALAKNAKFEGTKKIFEELKAEEQTHVIRLHRILVELVTE